jgi:hypothetical protein
MVRARAHAGADKLGSSAACGNSATFFAAMSCKDGILVGPVAGCWPPGWSVSQAVGLFNPLTG